MLGGLAPSRRRRFVLPSTPNTTVAGLPRRVDSWATGHGGVQPLPLKQFLASAGSRTSDAMPFPG